MMRRAGVAVYIHIVWATWDRLPLLQGEREARVYRAIAAKCQELGAQVIALGGIEDHVHLLVGMPANISIATLVGQVKGASSHLATHAIAHNSEFFKWQGAYGAVSVSPRHLPEVSASINDQRDHHSTHTLNDAWEMPQPLLGEESAADLG
jgi:REP element-mobilizing transposase RayT